jgi:anthranilate/para-aminobenzoate synthase component I
MQWLAEGDDQLAKRMGLLGMEKYEIVLQDSGDRVNTIKDDDLAIEEGMLGIMTWQHALQHLGEKIPAKFPLLTLWERHQNRKAQIEEEFDRQINPAREENRTEDEIRDEENRKQRRIERAKKLFPDIK